MEIENNSIEGYVKILLLDIFNIGSSLINRELLQQRS